jgi:hypothetical protein
MSLRDELQAIYDQHGELTPELVVQEARSKKHPLHDRIFDRAPAEAAEAWYRHRAHELIRVGRTVYKEADENGPERSVRSWQCVYGERGHVYEPVEKVVENPFTRQIVLRDMEREWKGLFARYEAFEEFLSLVSSDLQARAA